MSSTVHFVPSMMKISVRNVLRCMRSVHRRLSVLGLIVLPIVFIVLILKVVCFVIRRLFLTRILYAKWNRLLRGLFVCNRIVFNVMEILNVRLVYLAINLIWKGIVKFRIVRLWIAEFVYPRLLPICVWFASKGISWTLTSSASNTSLFLWHHLV